MNKKVFLLALWLLLCASIAQAQLMLNPMRMVFEPNRRALQLDLINTSNQAMTYRLSMVNRRMGENGEFSTVETPLPGERFAESLVQFSPRQLTLPAGGAQVVRMLVRKPADLEPGEYRSHLLIERVADSDSLSSVESLSGKSSGGFDIRLVPLVGASIPVIVRHGPSEFNLRLSELQIVRAGAAEPVSVSLTIERDGNRSAFGDLLLDWISENGEKRELARIGSVAVYVPNALRRMRVALTAEASAGLGKGVLRATFQQKPEDGGKTLAEQSLSLP